MCVQSNEWHFDMSMTDLKFIRKIKECIVAFEDQQARDHQLVREAKEFYQTVIAVDIVLNENDSVRDDELERKEQTMEIHVFDAVGMACLLACGAYQTQCHCHGQNVMIPSQFSIAGMLSDGFWNLNYFLRDPSSISRYSCRFLPHPSDVLRYPGVNGCELFKQRIYGGYMWEQYGDIMFNKECCGGPTDEKIVCLFCVFANQKMVFLFCFQPWMDDCGAFGAPHLPGLVPVFGFRDHLVYYSSHERHVTSLKSKRNKYPKMQILVYMGMFVCSECETIFFSLEKQLFGVGKRWLFCMRDCLCVQMHWNLKMNERDW